MGEDRREGETSVALLAWRVKALEQIELAMREELHDLRTRVPDRMLKGLREDYYTKAEAKNVFVTRREQSESSERHRQWPVILAGLVVSAITIADFIRSLVGG
jgi:hypothetical protein